jgi:hypothetical protein
LACAAAIKLSAGLAIPILPGWVAFNHLRREAFV